MNTIGRDKQFRDVLNMLSRMQSGATSHVHISVTAPRQGGLSTFLEDIHDLADAQDKLFPVSAAIRDGLDGDNVETAFALLFERICAELSIEETYDGLISTMLKMCDRLKEKGILPVLILDVAEGIREIERSHESLDQAKHAPLFDRLRALPNLLNDEDSNLAVIVGWDDDFRRHCGSWAADDVWQRYAPQIVLWPDFENDKPWETYREILEARGHKVEGDYPGFPRSGIPVGEILDFVKKDHKVVDGLFLLDLLADSKQIPLDEVGDLDRGLLSLLLLEDKTLPSDQIAENPQLQSVTSLAPEGDYFASEQLYRDWGVEPARSLISLERQTSQDFEQRPSEIVSDITKGTAELLGAASESIREIEDFCYFETVLDSSLLFDGLDTCNATIVVWLGREEGEQLIQFITAKIQEYEIDFSEPYSRFLFLVHRSDYAGSNNLAGRIHDQLRDRKSDYAGLQKSVGKKQSPVSFCRVSISLEEVIELQYLSRDSKRDANQTRSQFKSDIKEHGNRIFKNFPLLTPAIFESGILSNLIRRSFIPMSTDELAKQAELNVAKTKVLLVALEKSGAVQEVNGNWVWYPSADALRETIESGIELFESYFVSVSDLPKLKKAIVECYGNNLVREENNKLIGVSLTAFLKQRAQALTSQFDEEFQKLKTKSIDDANSVDPETRTQLGAAEEPSLIHELSIKIVSEIEKLQVLTKAVESKRSGLLESVMELRRQLESKSCDFDKELTTEKQELLSAIPPDHTPDLNVMKGRLELCINAHTRAIRERENAELLRKECLTQLNEEKKSIREIAKNAETSPDQDDVTLLIEKVSESEATYREQLTNWNEGLPNQPTSEILAELESISKGVGKLGAKTQSIESKIERVVGEEETRTNDPNKEVEFEDLCIEYGDAGIQQLIEILNSGLKIKSLEVKLPE